MFGKYTFEETEPKEVVYQFDFKGMESNDMDEYLQLYEDAGSRAGRRSAEQDAAQEPLRGHAWRRLQEPGQGTVVGTSNH